MAHHQRYALVTGASTGIGHAVVHRLAREGFHVFATVRQPGDQQALAAELGERVIPVLMDVTDGSQIDQAVAQVSTTVGDHGLDVLVNNAGVGVFQPLELVPLEQFRHQLEVNVTGHLAVTQRFLPLLRKARGRIVIIGSIADRITVPFAGPQSAAKRALLGVAEALRQELAPWNISTALIEPASIRTDALNKLERDTAAALDGFGPAGRKLYGPMFQRAIARAQEMEQGSGVVDFRRCDLR